MAEQKNNIKLILDGLDRGIEALNMLVEKAEKAQVKQPKSDDKVIADLARQVRDAHDQVAVLSNSVQKLEDLLEVTESERRRAPAPDGQWFYLRKVRREKVGGAALVIVNNIEGEDERLLGLDEWLTWELPEEI